MLWVSSGAVGRRATALQRLRGRAALGTKSVRESRRWATRGLRTAGPFPAVALCVCGAPRVRAWGGRVRWTDGRSLGVVRGRRGP